MSSVYADVIVDITNEKLDRTFQYKVPPELTGEIGPGTAVQIPFGNGNRTITGYVLSVGNEPKYPQDRMKAILAVQKDAGDCRDEAHRARRVDASYVRIDDDPGVKDGASGQSKGAPGKKPAKLRFLQIPQSVRSCWKTTERKIIKRESVS